MAVMSFAHLKTASRAEKKKMVSAPAAAKRTKVRPPEKKAEQKNSLPGGSFHESGSLDNVDLNASIITSKFCYGCEQFSVDAPMTEKEKAYCCRKQKKGDAFEFIFKRIRPETIIQQCPLVKHTQEKS